MDDSAADEMMMEAEEGVDGNEELKEWRNVTAEAPEARVWLWAMKDCEQTRGVQDAKQALRKIGKAKKLMKEGKDSGHDIVKELGQVKDAVLGVLLHYEARPRDWITHWAEEEKGAVAT